MISKTLQDGLNDYGIGAKIRSLRLKKKMGLVELGKHTGLSPALLSKIERGHLFPTLPTLLRISLVFSVGLDYFFARTKEAPATGRCARPVPRAPSSSSAAARAACRRCRSRSVRPAGSAKACRSPSF